MPKFNDFLSPKVSPKVSNIKIQLNRRLVGIHICWRLWNASADFIALTDQEALFVQNVASEQYVSAVVAQVNRSELKCVPPYFMVGSL